jgi:hypothetical protein
MRGRKMSVLGGAWLAIAGAMVLSTSVEGQAPARPAAAARPVPRTPDGHPDLQGTYDVATITPIERPARGDGRLSLSEAQAAAVEGAEKNRVVERAQPSAQDRDAPPVGGNVGGYNNFWIDRGSEVIRVDGQPRSSLIFDPADGRIPALTEAARQRLASSRFRNGPRRHRRSRSRAPPTRTPNNGRSASDACSVSVRRPVRRRCRTTSTTT